MSNKSLDEIIKEGYRLAKREPIVFYSQAHFGAGIEKYYLLRKFLAGKYFKTILDCGGTEFTFKILRHLQPDSKIISLNLIGRLIRHTEHPVVMDAERMKPREKVDLVVAFDLIEHLDPDKFMLSVARNLKAGGSLILSTPNLASWYNRLFLMFGRAPSTYDASVMWKLTPIADSVPAGHKTAFTTDSMRIFLTKFGFDVEKAGGYSYSEKVKKGNLFRKLLNRFLPVGMREGMLVLARKVRKPDEPSEYYHIWVEGKIMKGVMRSKWLKKMKSRV